MYLYPGIKFIVIDLMSSRTKNGYLITKDIVPTLINKLGIYELKNLPHAQKKLKELENAFVGEFSEILRSGTLVRAVDAEDIAAALRERISAIAHENPNHLTVSLDRVYGPVASYHIEITRALEPITGRSFHGANRFNSLPVEVQVSDLKLMQEIKKRNNKGMELTVILADVGTYEGKTIKRMMRMLSKEGIIINKVVVGIATEKGYTTLRNAYGDAIIACNIERDLYEWMELRDLMLIDGRQALLGSYTNGVRYFVPYSELLVKEAKVPKRKEQEAIEICYRFHNEIMDLLKDLGIESERIGKHVKLAETIKIALRNSK